mmetsp:Transcript_108432/g.192052  ORF Transcript_108432/g.192052 Transcript_108432/m.192052 type:complete len:129 (-) Transcript_108432:20-406(-)
MGSNVACCCYESQSTGVTGDEPMPGVVQISVLDEPEHVAAAIKKIEYTIILDKSAGTKLGMDVDMQDGGSLVVESVKGGLAEKWNDENPGMTVKPKDHIVEVNGVRDIEGIIGECKKNVVLKMALVRG